MDMDALLHPGNVIAMQPGTASGPFAKARRATKKRSASRRTA